MRKITRSACSIAAAVCCRIRGVSPSSPGSSPAVSTSVTSQGPTVASASRGSRVNPGWSSTRASRLPASRLNKVDLPTFGRPTMAIVKDISVVENSALIEGDQRSVVSQDIHAAAGYNRRDEDWLADVEIAHDLSGSRIGTDKSALTRHHPELAPGQHRAAPARAVGKVGRPPHFAIGAGE